MPQKSSLALLFSGGADSTYTATLMAEDYEKIHLITYDRVGLKNTQNSSEPAKKLKEKFGANKFIHRIINIDEFYKKISYSNYMRDVIRFRFFVLLSCGLCKLAMHWRTLIYCLDHHIKYVCDGSNKEMLDPSQDEEVLKRMRELYKEFGIEYFNPVYCASEQIRQKTIFDLGLSPVQYIKNTRFSWERQPFCTQEHLFIKLYNYACLGWDKKKKGPFESGKAKYRRQMLLYHELKRNYIQKQIHEYLKVNA